MAITGKPPKQNTAAQNEERQANDDMVKQLINKGGTPPQMISSDTNDLKKVQLRLPQNVLDEIDEVLSKRNSLTRPSRHTWLLEAIAEKLDREKL